MKHNHLRKAGSNLMAKMASNSGRAHSTLEDNRFSQASIQGKAMNLDNPYGGISVSDMFMREAKAQFDGNVPRYPVPDTRSMTYKVKYQTKWNNSKTKRNTFVDELYEAQKKDKFKGLAPNSYKTDKALDNL